MSTPSWAEAYQQQARAGLWVVARAAPRTVRVLAVLAWRASPRLTSITLGTQLVAAVVTTFGLLATADVFTRLLAQGPTPSRVLIALPSIAVVVAATVLRASLQAAVAATSAELVPLVEQQARTQFYGELAEVELLEFDDAEFTELINRTESRGIAAAQRGAELVGELLASAVSAFGAVAAVGLLHPALAPVILLAAAPQGWASMQRARLHMISFVETLARNRRRDLAADLLTNRAGAAEIRACTAARPVRDEIRKLDTELATEGIRLARRENLVTTLGRALAGIGAACAYLVLGLLLYAGALPLALAGTAAVAMRGAGQSVVNGVFAINRLFETGVNLRIYQDCLAELRNRRRPEATGRLDGATALVELRDVRFRYPGQVSDALHGIDLTLRLGEVVALVGENGSGKSTLAKVITGLYLPSDGTVCWDGVDIASVAATERHDRIGLVAQEPLRWPSTAELNVRIGRLERADQDGSDPTALESALRASGADEVVDELPDGLNTLLSRVFADGRDLSGGQWQRLSVARGLYRNAGLLVADEPTSAMDARAEHAVFAALRDRAVDTPRGARITVLVTHRLANIRDADQIVVLEHGRIAERGTHDQLIAAGGIYHQLFALQAQAYRD